MSGKKAKITLSAAMTCIFVTADLRADEFVLAVSRNTDRLVRINATQMTVASDFAAAGVVRYPAGVTRTAWNTYLIVAGASAIEFEIDGSVRRAVLTGCGSCNNAAITDIGTIILPNGAEFDYWTGLFIRAMSFPPSQFVENIGNGELALLNISSGVINVVRSIDGSALRQSQPIGALSMSRIDGGSSLLVTRTANDDVVRFDTTAMQLQDVVASGAGLAQVTSAVQIGSGHVLVATDAGTVFDFFNGQFVRFLPPIPGAGHFVDLQLLQDAPCTAPIQGDIDGDQDVDLQDLAIVLSNFGRRCP